MIKTGIIYLAAGNSRRFGTNKLLYKLDGKPMYQHLFLRLLHICKNCPHRVLAVVTQYEEIYGYVSRLEREGLPVRAVFSPESKAGVSYSVASGIRALEKEKMSGFAFFAADQPYLTEKSAQGFLEEMEQRRTGLGSVCCKGTVGNPTWFAKEYIEELLSLSGDEGGRKILKKYPAQVCFFEIEDAGELKDIDEP